MKQNPSIVQAMMPWTGLVVGVLAVAIVHQFGSDGAFDKCETMAPGPLLVVAVIGLLACAIAGLVSWRSLRSDEDGARRVVAIISVGCSAVFGLAIVFPIIAALVLPPCFR